MAPSGAAGRGFAFEGKPRTPLRILWDLGSLQTARSCVWTRVTLLATNLWRPCARQEMHYVEGDAQCIGWCADYRATFDAAESSEVDAGWDGNDAAMHPLAGKFIW